VTPQRLSVRLPKVRPVITYALIAINVLIFVVRALSPSLDEQIFEVGANIPRLVLQGGEFYRLLTAMFLHAGIYDLGGRLVPINAMHLILNMYVLYAVGTQLEGLFGHVRFFLIYLLGGLMASAFSAVLGSADSASVGASGAVFAILGAEFIFLYQHRKLLGARAVAQMRSLVMLAVINFAYGALTSVAGTVFRVDNWGHLGGLLGGLGLAWFLTPALTPKVDPATPGLMRLEDGNPLERRYWVLFAYAVILVVVLTVGTLNARL
jgi:rhomboid protease GluP